MSLKYFAYGSNMCSVRLRARVPCQFVTVARLTEYQLRFHKLSKKDRSSKCNAFYTGVATDEVWGVVFDIPASMKANLDRIEGLGYGYEDASVAVTSKAGERMLARTYVADPKFIEEGLAPYTWYKAYVLAGAAEHGLNPDYVSRAIESVVATDDPNKDRNAEETAKLPTSKLK